MAQTSSKAVETSRRYLDDEFPSPTDLPDAEILIIDGACAFCKGQARTLMRLVGKRVAFMSLHDPEVTERFPDLTYDQLMEAMVLIDANGRRHVGAAAVRRLALRTPLLWPIALLMHIPFTLPLWQRIYHSIAVRRYRLGAKREQAKLAAEHQGESAEGQGGDDVCEDACSVHLNR